ncbi:hypothetical protein FE810_14905 [Thalassotalea litorea]|uniref:Aerotolerance regulator N-terminal domain-containing protein n=1 Tax=Thalassotalea litorea TaxID=2020715 RepID=A0A5R9IGN1_9GAMM|nr:BatA domain-containing protein [Thalassotalea litorea]TLU61298.1 hypothetical protein FE810_14905 [Thalassotalea litorea]
MTILALFSSALINFYFPALMLGLLALAIVVYIHWFTQQKPQTRAFALLDLLPDTKPMATTQIQLQEKRLFWLRSCLLLLSVLLIAGAFFTNFATTNLNTSRIKLVSMGYLQSANREELSKLVNSSDKNVQSLLLLPNYPEFTDELYEKIISAKSSSDDAKSLLEIVTSSDAHGVIAANDWQGIDNFFEYIHAQENISFIDKHLDVYATRQLAYYLGEQPSIKHYQQLNFHFPKSQSLPASWLSKNSPPQAKVLIIAHVSREQDAMQLQRAMARISASKIADIAVSRALDTEVFPSMPATDKGLLSRSLADLNGVFYLPALTDNNPNIERIVAAMPDNGVVFSESSIQHAINWHAPTTGTVDLPQQSANAAGLLLEPVNVLKYLPATTKTKRADYQGADFTTIWQETVWQHALANRGQQPVLLKRRIEITDSAALYASQQQASQQQAAQEYTSEDNSQEPDFYDQALKRQQENTIKSDHRQVTLWQLNTRFDRQWSDLLEQRQLPHLLYVWLFSNGIEAGFNQNYLLSHALIRQQVRTDQTAQTTEDVTLAKAVAKKQSQQLNDVQQENFRNSQSLLAILFCLVFIAERWLSEWGRPSGSAGKQRYGARSQKEEGVDESS